MVNIKKKNIELSESNLNELLGNLKAIKESFNNLAENIVEDMAEYVKQQTGQNLANTPYRDGNDDCESFAEINGKKAKAGMKGSQVAYNEFGTGTVGENSDHENRMNVSGLNWYNTGVTIRTNVKNKAATQNGIPENGLYWTYEVNGEKKYTQGIPAGKQVYDASKALESKKEKIIKKRVGEVISKL